MELSTSVPVRRTAATASLSAFSSYLCDEDQSYDTDGDQKDGADLAEDGHMEREFDDFAEVWSALRRKKLIWAYFLHFVIKIILIWFFCSILSLGEFRCSKHIWVHFKQLCKVRVYHMNLKPCCLFSFSYFGPC